MITDDEIRVKCAEAMGWKRVEGSDLWKSPLQVSGIMKGPWFKYIAIPRYDTSVDAALTLCDRLRSEGWYVSLGAGKRHWRCSVCRVDSDDDPIVHEDPSLARAICVPFLRVKGEAK